MTLTATQPLASGVERSNQRWKVLAAGVFANMSFTFTVGGIPAASVFIREQYGMTGVMVGLLMGMMGLGIAMSEIPWGMLTDRYGDRPVLLAGLVGVAVTLGLIAFASRSAGPDQVTLLMSGLLLAGLIGSSVNGSSGKAIMSWFMAGERGLAMSIRQTAVPMGYGLGAVAYPYLALHFSLAIAYGVSALACAFAALLASRWIVEPPVAPLTVVCSPQRNEVSPLARWAVWRIVLAIGLLCAPQFAVMTFAMIFLHDTFGISVSAISAVLFLIQMSSIATRISSGKWTDRHQNRRSYLKVCSLICGLAFSVLAMLSAIDQPRIDGLWIDAVVIALLVCGVVVSAWHGVGYTELAYEAGTARIATALSMGNAVVFLALFTTPTVIPLVCRWLSWSGVWCLMALICVAACCLFPGRESTHRK